LFNVTCAICKGTAQKKSAAELPCRHYYCRVCILQWFLVKNSCPLCNIDIDSIRIFQISSENIITKISIQRIEQSGQTKQQYKRNYALLGPNFEQLIHDALLFINHGPIDYESESKDSLLDDREIRKAEKEYRKRQKKRKRRKRKKKK